jgi:P27 family predicted phage terminase small subunit
MSSNKDKGYMRLVADGAPAPKAKAAHTAEAQAPNALGNPPAYFDDKQKAVWVELAGTFSDRLGESDAPLFAKLVAAETLYRGASAEVSRVGVLIKSPTNYPIQNPYLAVVNKQHAFIVRTMSELGLTPLARGRVKPTKASRARRDNPFSNLRTLED